jgi:hypothetical protein
MADKIKIGRDVEKKVVVYAGYYPSISGRTEENREKFQSNFPRESNRAPPEYQSMAM